MLTWLGFVYDAWILDRLKGSTYINLYFENEDNYWQKDRKPVHAS